MLTGRRIGRFAFIAGPVTGLILFCYDREWIWHAVSYAVLLGLVLAIKWPHHEWGNAPGEPLVNFRAVCGRVEAGLIIALILVPCVLVMLFLGADWLPTEAFRRAATILEGQEHSKEVSRLTHRVPVDAPALPPPSDNAVYVARAAGQALDIAPGVPLMRLVVRPYLENVKILVTWAAVLMFLASFGLFLIEHLSQAFIRDLPRHGG